MVVNKAVCQHLQVPHAAQQYFDYKRTQLEGYYSAPFDELSAKNFDAEVHEYGGGDSYLLCSSATKITK